MAAARPLVSVYDAKEGSVSSQVSLPDVFVAPIRPDVVQFVHTNMAKNARQAYCVNKDAGMQAAAESWGTGRAVARIPRVPGGGTSRSGQGAFGNMCRGGRMFGPTRQWRKWHRKVNVNQRRYATTAALAASALPALVMARGHRVSNVPEVPLVVSNTVETMEKTSDATAFLARFGLDEDVEKCRVSKKLRRGKGKMRDRRYVMRRGPLIVHADGNCAKAFRNLPGVELCHVDRMNLLQLAPGGHVGRLIVWTQAAFEKLDAIYGTYTTASTEKTNYTLPRHSMQNADLARIINSDEVQSVVRAAKVGTGPRCILKKNPLKNKAMMRKLNPYSEVVAKAESKAKADKKKRKAAIKGKRAKAQGRAELAKMLE